MSGLRFRRPMGDVSRRLHGVILQLRSRSVAARFSAVQAEERGEVEFAASLRGKAVAYREAVDLLALLDAGRPIRRRNRWLTAPAPATEASESEAAG